MDGSARIEMMEVNGGVRRKYQAKQGTEYGQIDARREYEGKGWPDGKGGGGWLDDHARVSEGGGEE